MDSTYSDIVGAVFAIVIAGAFVAWAYDVTIGRERRNRERRERDRLHGR